MNFFYILYILEALSYFLLPKLFFDTDSTSYLFLGFCFLLPVGILTLIILKKSDQPHKLSITIHWIIVAISIIFSLYLLAVYNAANSIGTI